MANEYYIVELNPRWHEAQRNWARDKILQWAHNPIPSRRGEMPANSPLLAAWDRLD